MMSKPVRRTVSILGDCPILSLLVVLLLAPPAAGEVFVGAKIGWMRVDTPTDSSPINAAFDFGYQIDTSLANLTLAGEINRTISSGKTNRSNDLKFKSDGMYLIYKTNKALYWTVRGGVVRDKIVADTTSDRKAGLSVGGGFGGVVGEVRIQIEFTAIAGDANFLSIGLD